MSCKYVVDAASEQQQRQRGEVARDADRMETFPWITEFRVLSRLPTRPGSLIKLIRFFNKNVSSSAVDCKRKSSHAAKLKEYIKETLLLFIYRYRFEQPQDQNRAVYLEQMSDLLAVYVDLELIVSKRQVEPQPRRISARLVSTLCLCLENSPEHLLDTIIKVQRVSESYCDILDPVISKVIKLASPSRKSKLDGIGYVRYLLVYRLWKRLHTNVPVRKNIVGLALKVLKFRPPDDLPVDILIDCGVLPASQNSQSNKSPTQHYLFAGEPYDLRKACDQFIKYSKSQNVDETPTFNNSSSSNNSRNCSSNSSSCSSSSSGISSSSSTISRNCSSNSSSCSSSSGISSSSSTSSSCSSSSSGISSSSSGISSRNCSSTSSSSSSSSECNERDPRHLARRKRRFREVVLIDLTNEPITTTIEYRTRPRIGWLENVKRNLRNLASKLNEKRKAAAVANRRTTKKLISYEEYKRRMRDKKTDAVSL